MISLLQVKDYINENKQLRALEITELSKVSFLAQGEYNINFLVVTELKNYVLRVNIQSQLQLENQIEYEYQSLKFLEQTGVTPKVYYVDNTKIIVPYGILIMEYLEGKPLNYDLDLIKAASIFGTIHSLKIENTSHFIVEESIFSARIKEAHYWMNGIWNSPYLPKETCGKLEALFNYALKHEKEQIYFLKNPWTVINNTEVNSHNFIIGERNNYLIDWEKPVISDPAQDLTQFLAPTTTLWKTNYLIDEATKERFFTQYERSSGLEKSDIHQRVQMYEPYLLLRALTWCANAFVYYHDPNKVIKNEDTFNKIKEFLDVQFLNKILNKYS